MRKVATEAAAGKGRGRGAGRAGRAVQRELREKTGRLIKAEEMPQLQGRGRKSTEKKKEPRRGWRGSNRGGQTPPLFHSQGKSFNKLS